MRKFDFRIPTLDQSSTYVATPVIPIEPVERYSKEFLEAAAKAGMAPEEYEKFLISAQNSKTTLSQGDTRKKSSTEKAIEQQAAEKRVAEQTKRETEAAQAEQAVKEVGQFSAFLSPSTYVNMGLQSAGKDPLSDGAATAVDIGTDLGLGLVTGGAYALGKGALRTGAKTTSKLALKPVTKEGLAAAASKNSNLDLLKSINGYNAFEMANGRRRFVVVDIPGIGPIPYYISSKGTDGKIKGDFYPFFGIGNNGHWLIKGGVDSKGLMQYTPEIDNIAFALNQNPLLKILGEPLSYNKIKIPGINLQRVEDYFNLNPEQINLGSAINGFVDSTNKIAYKNGIPILLPSRAEIPGLTSIPIDELFIKELTGLDGSGIINGVNSQNYIQKIIYAKNPNKYPKHAYDEIEHAIKMIERHRFEKGGTVKKLNYLDYFKSGSKINIKKSHKGEFTKYCKGTVTEECIKKGKNSPDPKIRKQATFADNARHWVRKGANGLSTRLAEIFSDYVPHIVSHDESIYDLADRFNVSVKDIMELNDLTSKNISVGTKLRIPKRSEAQELDADDTELDYISSVNPLYSGRTSRAQELDADDDMTYLKLLADLAKKAESKISMPSDVTAPSVIVPTKEVVVAEPGEVPTPESLQGRMALTMQYLMSKGFSREAAAGVTGVFAAESGLRPGILNVDEDAAYGLSAGRGIAQWSNSRRQDYERYFAGKTPTLKQEIDYFIEDLSKYVNLKDLKTSDLKTAVDLMTRGYEAGSESTMASDENLSQIYGAAYKQLGYQDFDLDDFISKRMNFANQAYQLV